MPAGRPTDYTPELLDKAYTYMEKYEELGDVVPSHVGLAIYLDKSRVCLYDWAKQEDKKEFSYILDKIMDMQLRGLSNGGLSGDLNSNITKLMLGKHGYHDKQELRGDKDNPIALSLNVEFVDSDTK